MLDKLFGNLFLIPAHNITHGFIYMLSNGKATKDFTHLTILKYQSTKNLR